jgi:hypothetical protein
MKSSAIISLLLLAVPSVFAGNHGNRLTRKHQARAALASVDQELIEKRSNLEVRDEHNNTLTKRAFSGRGTFYYTDVGLGACGESAQWLLWSQRMFADVYSSLTTRHSLPFPLAQHRTPILPHRPTLAEQRMDRCIE